LAGLRSEQNVALSARPDTRAPLTSEQTPLEDAAFKNLAMAARPTSNSCTLALALFVFRTLTTVPAAQPSQPEFYGFNRLEKPASEFSCLSNMCIRNPVNIPADIAAKPVPLGANAQGQSPDKPCAMLPQYRLHVYQGRAQHPVVSAKYSRVF
jgi:hypothetical protein